MLIQRLLGIEGNNLKGVNTGAAGLLFSFQPPSIGWQEERLRKGDSVPICAYQLERKTYTQPKVLPCVTIFHRIHDIYLYNVLPMILTIQSHPTEWREHTLSCLLFLFPVSLAACSGSSYPSCNALRALSFLKSELTKSRHCLSAWYFSKERSQSYC